MTLATHNQTNPSALKSTISVRQFVDADRAAVAKLFYDVILSLYPDPAHKAYHQWRDFAQRRLDTDMTHIYDTYIAPGGNFWVAVATDSSGVECIAGIAGLERKPSAVGEVRSMFVSVDHHRLGVGRALMTTMEEWSREQGIKYLFLTTPAQNRQSRGFYESLGYENRPHDPPIVVLGVVELAKYIKQI